MRLEEFIDITAALRPGVYALYYRGTCVYVGQSKCMLTRIYSHKSRGDRPSWHPIRSIVFDSARIYPVAEPSARSALEAALIRRHQPRCNIHHQPKGALSAPLSLVVNGTPIRLSPKPFERRV